MLNIRVDFMRLGFYVFILFLGLSATNIYAETAIATATDTTVTDAVVMTQIIEKHSDIKPSDLHKDLNQTTTQTNQPSAPPRQSTASTVAYEKLLLNQPVIDQAQILTVPEKEALEQKLRSIFQRHLAQPAIVLVSSTGNMDIFDYTMRLADKWQLGDKQIDNGLLIVVAINDRKIFIATGYGLEGVLPDAIVNRIIRDDISPHFKQSDYATGLLAGLEQIEYRLSTDPEILAQADKRTAQSYQTQNEEKVPITSILIFGVILGGVLVNIFGRLLGSTLSASAVGFMTFFSGAGFITSLGVIIAIFLFLILGGSSLIGGLGNIAGSTGGRRSSGGSFPSYRGGGGGFGGGGAGGSW